MDKNKIKEYWILWTFFAIILLSVLFAIFTYTPESNGDKPSTKTIVQQEENKKDTTEKVKYDISSDQIKIDEAKNKYNKDAYINTALSSFKKDNTQAYYDEGTNKLYLILNMNQSYESLNLANENTQFQLIQIADKVSDISLNYRNAQSNFNGVNIDVVCTVIDLNGNLILQSTNGSMDYFKLTDE